jgi:putative mRNA 3-end processing factor
VAGPLITVAAEGLYCEAGGFHIDPWLPVPRALVTHAHADHARPGSTAYLCAAESAPLLRRRFADDAPTVQPVAYGERLRLGDAAISFHPAGHVLGSAQIRVEGMGEVWVVSGDYKRVPDRTCAPFEPVACDVFITEATFALPVYRWPFSRSVARDILAWWDENRAAERPAVLFCYALGKAQRILSELAELTDRSVYVHGAVAAITDVYRGAGVPMLPTVRVGDEVSEGGRRASRRPQAPPGELILAPESAIGTPWMRRFSDAETAFASGWMQLRGTRRRRALDRGFVLSDHADWAALLQTIRETGAARVLTTHGYSEVLARYLNESGIAAEPLVTRFEGEGDV